VRAPEPTRWQILISFAAVGYLLNVAIPALEQPTHIAGKHNVFAKLAENSARGFESHFIPHQGDSIASLKIVIVAKPPKATANPAILEITWALERGDPAGVRKHKAKVANLPSHFLIRSDQPWGDALQWPAHLSNLSMPSARRYCELSRSSGR
jgi:hypothetical protein